jgi:glucose/arabinose dehydrogenase
MSGHNMSIMNKERIRKLENPRHNYMNVQPIFFSLSIFLLFYLFSLSFWSDYKILGQNQDLTTPKPSLTDSNLKIELVASGFEFPTSMAFVDRDDILLLEKNIGNVYRIVNGNVTHQLLHLDVSSKDERGLLGIALSGNDDSNQNDTNVFLYYTQCPKVKGQDKGSQDCGNYVYKYRFDSENNKLVDPKLILSLPALPTPSHIGGILQMDKDKNLYVTTGDMQTTKFNQNQTGFDTRAQNIINGTAPDGRAGILRITQDGEPVGQELLGNDYPLSVYYAYGIKNSFGIGFDPVTGNLWDTENGPQFGDEINLVEPGFNSGWEKVQGIWKLNETREKEGIFNDSNKVEFIDFDGKGNYSDPEFVWDKPVAPTALVFLNSDKLGQQYENDMFVGSAKKGTIFHFDLNEDRKSLDLTGDLADLVYSKKDESSNIIFGENFGIVTDLEVGPDGYLYVVSALKKSEGKVYRIIPK